MNFLEGLEEGKEFRTEVTETTRRDHGEVSEFFSVHSVSRWFDNANHCCPN
jgi:hypothetical protein